MGSLFGGDGGGGGGGGKDIVPPVTVPPITPQQTGLINAEQSLIDTAVPLLSSETATAQSVLPLLLGRSGISTTPFNAEAYWAANPDIANDATFGRAAGPQAAYKHYLTFGQFEGRTGGIPSATDQYGPQVGMLTKNYLDIAQGFQDRTKAALAGGLPDDPALLQQLALQEQQLRATYRSQLGPGYEQSQPFIDAFKAFTDSKTAALQSSRNQALGQASTYGAQNIAASQQQPGMLGTNLRGDIGLGYGSIPQYSLLANAYGLPANQLFQQQGLFQQAGLQNQRLQTDANIAALDAQARVAAAGTSGLFGLGGTLLGSNFQGSGLQSLIGGVGNLFGLGGGAAGAAGAAGAGAGLDASLGLVALA